MAEEVGKGKVTVEADTDGLGKSIASGVDKESSFITKAFGGVGKIAGAAFKAAAIGVAAGVVAAGALAKSSVDAASDLSESMSKVDVVFGDNAKAVQDWSKKSATAFGQSRQSALEAAGTYGNLFQAFGIGQAPAQEMSQTLVELAADLASFNNTSVEEALDSLRSGLSGETEPLKKYGVAINDVRLREQALAMGLISSTKDALTPAAKAQATYALVLQDTTLAQGDFARTSDGLANQQRILSARFTDMKAKLGAVLLPAFLAVVTFVGNKVIPTFEKLGDFIRGGFTGEFTNEGSGIFLFANRLGMRLGELVDWIKANWPQIRTIIGSVLEAVGKLLAWVADKVLTGLRIAIVETVDFIRRHWDTIKEVFTTAAEVIASTVTGAIDVIRNIVTFLADNEGLLAGIAVVIAGVLVGALISWTAATYAQVTALWAQAAAFAAANAPLIIITAALAALVAAVIYAYQNWGWFRDAVDAVRAWMVDTLWPALQAVFGWLRDNVPPIVQAVAGWITGTLWPALQAVWSFIVEHVFPIFQAVFGWLRDNVPGIIAAVVSAIQTFWGWLQTLWDRSEGLRAFLADAFRLAFDVVTTAVGWLVTAISTAYDWFQTFWDRAEPLRAFLAGAFWLAVTIIGTAFDAISTAVGIAWGWFQTIWDKGLEVAGYFEGAFKTGIELVGGAWDIVSSAIETAVGWLGDVIEWAGKALSPLQKVIDAAAAVKDIITADINSKINPNLGIPVDPNKFDDGNADGGRMARFGSYLVGERGPEVVKMGSIAGYTTPNHRLRADLASLAGDSAGRAGPAVEFSGPINLSDQIDVDALASTIVFMVEAA